MTDAEIYIIGLLTEIRDELKSWYEQPEEGEICPHPEQERVSLSSQGDPNHWVCKLCRHDNKTGPSMN